MKTFAKKSISTLRTLFSSKKKYFEKIFAFVDVYLAKLKIDFRKIFVKASLSQNLQNSGFWPIFHQNFSYKNSHNLRYINLEKFSEKFYIVRFFADCVKKIRNKKVNYPLKLSNLKKYDVILQLYKRF